MKHKLSKMNQILLLKKQSFKNVLFIFIASLILSMNALAQDFEIMSSFNPIGSGARAIGMGGAFIAVADDATAASWNPGGLVQLRQPEFSFVHSHYNRREDNHFPYNPEASRLNELSESDINYLSIVYPFNLLDYNMVVSLSTQNLYDFNREWTFRINDGSNSVRYWDYQQKGNLSALGLSYCIQYRPNFSFGFTVNIWDEDITNNYWQQNYYERVQSEAGGQFFKREEYVFDGTNVNVGFLWRPNRQLTIGAVLKTPFKADIVHQTYKNYVNEQTNESYPEITKYNEIMKMPMSYGVGLAYLFSDFFSISMDLYRTQWDSFYYQNYNGIKKSITQKPVENSDVYPTNHFRMGCEYLLNHKGLLVPLRSGLFYDPGPAENNSDDLYGFSTGIGFTKFKQQKNALFADNIFSIDFAYQYRHGNNIGSHLVKNWEFSQDFDEHIFYTSVIIYNH